MSGIKSEDFIEELRFDLKTKDLLKARLVLAHLGDVDKQTQRLTLFELSRAADDMAIELIVGVLASQPELENRYPQLKEVLYLKALDSPTTFLTLLSKTKKKSHQALMAEIAGEIRLDGATPVLLEILNTGHDQQVLKSAVAALGMLGDLSATTAVSEYLYAGSMELIASAISALGQFASPTAIQRLWERLDTDPQLDIMILDALAASQIPEALEKLNQTLSSQHAHLRNAGKQCLRKIGVKAVPVLIGNLHHDDPDLLVHTLDVLGQIGDDSAIVPIRKLLFNEPRDPNVRFAAYEAMGNLSASKGAFALAQGLHDPVDNVRIAAARAIDTNYNLVLSAGLKNMLRSDSPEARQIGQTLIDAECDRIFLDLIEQEPFRKRAVEYLQQEAHPDIRKHFVQILKENDFSDLAAEIDTRQANGSASAPCVYAVDDSKMVLSIYRTMLHKLGCNLQLFAVPAEALAQIREQKPDLVFTDLNMPEINGIELTREIRRLYDRKQLPVVMVTTQGESQDRQAALSVGVNTILHKPFTEEMIADVLSEFIPQH